MPTRRISADQELSDEIRELFLRQNDFREHNRAIVMDFFRQFPGWQKLGQGRPAFNRISANMMTLILYVHGCSEREIGEFCRNPKHPGITSQAVGKRVSRAVAEVSRKLGCSTMKLARDCYRMRKGS